MMMVTIWDEDTVSSDDLIGKIEIPFNSLSEEELTEQWWKIQPSHPKEHVSGEINLKLKFVPESAVATSGQLFVTGSFPSSLTRSCSRTQFGKSRF